MYLSACVSMFSCAKKEKKIIGGPMPYLVEPLKHWMSRLWRRQFGFYKLIMCGLMLVLCHMNALWVLVLFCQRLLKRSAVVQERSCVHTDLGSEDAPSVFVQRVAGLICDQVEAAFFFFFLVRVLLLYRHVFCFFILFFYLWMKNLWTVQICVCVYSEVPRRVRKIPQLVIAITFQKCKVMRSLSERCTIKQFWKAPATDS